MKRLRLFAIRINDDEWNQIHRLSKHYGCAASEVVRDLVRREADHVDRAKEDDPGSGTRSGGSAA